jgi:hypothetical protein
MTLKSSQSHIRLLLVRLGGERLVVSIHGHDLQQVVEILGSIDSLKLVQRGNAGTNYGA